MEKDQKLKYMEAVAGAVALVVGPRDEDYNKGGIGLRDYWETNGIMSPVQMVDMKLKRALSQLANWNKDVDGNLLPPSRAAVDKLNESMFDLINYAAFVVCEAESLFDDVTSAVHEFDQSPGWYSSLGHRLGEAVKLWQEDNRGRP